jgi:hypothetical protein
MPITGFALAAVPLALLINNTRRAAPARAGH